MRKPMSYREVPTRASMRIASSEDDAPEQRDPPDQGPDRSASIASARIVQNPRPFRVRVTLPEPNNG